MDLEVGSLHGEGRPLACTGRPRGAGRERTTAARLNAEAQRRVEHGSGVRSSSQRPVKRIRECRWQQTAQASRSAMRVTATEPNQCETQAGSGSESSGAGSAAEPGLNSRRTLSRISGFVPRLEGNMHRSTDVVQSVACDAAETQPNGSGLAGRASVYGQRAVLQSAGCGVRSDAIDVVNLVHGVAANRSAAGRAGRAEQAEASAWAEWAEEGRVRVYGPAAGSSLPLSCVVRACGSCWRAVLARASSCRHALVRLSKARPVRMNMQKAAIFAQHPAYRGAVTWASVGCAGQRGQRLRGWARR